MARTKYAKCCKCGAWRHDDEELTHHITICTAFRCPQCGMPAHDGHHCINNTVVYRTKNLYKLEIDIREAL